MDVCKAREFAKLEVCAGSRQSELRELARRGFTLIELLVVVAIIALLMSIMMPVVDKVKRQAKAVVCQTNLHDWAVVFEMSTGDNEGRFLTGEEYGELMDGPSGFTGEAKIDDEDHSWPLVLRPYYGDEKLLCCPEATKAPPYFEGGRETGERQVVSIVSTWGLWIKYDTDYMYGSYGINSWSYDRGPHNEVRRWRKISVRGGNNIPLLLDCYWCEGYPRHENQPPPARFSSYLGDPGNFMRRFCVDRHMEATNGLFYDLSTRRVGLKELWELEWHPDWNPNNDPPPEWPEWMKRMKDYAY